MRDKVHVSVVVPAHNEEKYVKRCIDSIKESSAHFKGNVETIIVCNRCTDKPEDIAKANGAVVVLNEDRCIAKVRNAGINVAKAKLLKTYGKSQGKKYTTLRRNYLINSTRKYDDLGDWLYFKLMINNAGTLIKAALGNTEEYDKLLDEMFYDYNDNH